MQTRKKAEGKRDALRFSRVRSKAYIDWVKAGKPKPYLNEAQVGVGFSFYALFQLVLLVAFVGGWLYTMLMPMLRSEKEAQAIALERAEGDRTDGIGSLLQLGEYITPTPNTDELVLTLQATMMPNATPTEIIEASPTATPEPTPTTTHVVGLHVGYGLQSVKCVDCASYDVVVRLTNYWPDTLPTIEEIEKGKAANKFGNERFITTANCWKYDLLENRCASAMESELPWRSFVGWAAACPYDWPHGTVVHVPALGRTFWCLDRGTMVCAGGVCDVDVLTEQLPQNGGVFNAVIQVPGW